MTIQLVTFGTWKNMLKNNGSIIKWLWMQYSGGDNQKLLATNCKKLKMRQNWRLCNYQGSLVLNN